MANDALTPSDPIGVEVWVLQFLRLTGACASVPDQRVYLPQSIVPLRPGSRSEEPAAE
ncbi:hypothetical protein [Microtetraspora malaysiensis]|uniref:hypothetical protein n=1 Tax=Microtetraspora malaysiensis TaxID=161358 RepID=UPI000A4277AF|nr:hypothetical protein [Microtetraspora malaysiensis]